MARIVGSLAEVAESYDAAFVDLWGCVHDGVRAFPPAVEALRAFRASGKRVVLVTNAPRPRASVAAQLGRVGVPPDAWDAIATSGDAARVAMFRGAIGTRVWFMGQPHDLAFFEPPRIVADPLPIARVALEEAEGVACCAPFDVHADPDASRPDLARALGRGLPLLCANPDIVVDRGEVREWCAGAVARLYEEMGGRSLYFGKPHGPIYDLARLRLAATDGGAVADARILAVGDGVATDVRGAAGEGLDCLFVTGGLPAAETRTPPGGQPEAEALAAYLAAEGLAPAYAVGFLR